MESIDHLSEHHVLLFLTQLFTLLTLAKIVGDGLRRYGCPPMVGEILVGIVLGPTILGRTLPGLHGALFPDDAIQRNMLETVSWFGVLFLLMATGFEINISRIWRQGKEATLTGVVGVVVPLVVGVGVFWWFPESQWGSNANRVTFTLFLATAAAISGIPVIARALHDLDILKTDLALSILSAFVINDILGWLIFTLVLSLAGQHGAISKDTFRVFFEIVMFGTLCLTIGSNLVGKASKKLREANLPQPATTLTFISCLAMFCGAVTQWIGVHAMLGFFLAGIMVGNTNEISEQTRVSITQIMHAVFVPIFFATIGLNIDFLSNLALAPLIIFTIVAIGAKFVGAWLGATMSKMPRLDAFSVGIAHIPGGAMEIILGILALKMGLITETIFVAIVFAALLSSILVGPLLAWCVKLRRAVDAVRFLTRETVIFNLKSKNRYEAISELCERIAFHAELDATVLERAVRKREEIMGTGFEKGLAVPHARIPGLERPRIAFGRSPLGIDWDTRDGRLVHFIFMVVTPEGENDLQVQIMAAIAKFMIRTEIQESIMLANGDDAIFQILNDELSLPTPG